jgi:hypothetical protein
MDSRQSSGTVKLDDVGSGDIGVGTANEAELTSEIVEDKAKRLTRILRLASLWLLAGTFSETLVSVTG